MTASFEREAAPPERSPKLPRKRHCCNVQLVRSESDKAPPEVLMKCV